MWSNYAFGIVLVGVALLLTVFQVRAARRLRFAGAEDAHESQYLRARYRRHAITNALIALTGAAIMGAGWVRSPQAILLYWGVVMLLVAAIIYSALVDVGATRTYYGQLRRQQAQDRASLEAELQKYQVEQERGGKPDSDGEVS